MAKTYYKYQDRAVASQIDWGEIGKELTDTLALQKAGRQKVRDDIDQATTLFAQELNKTPQGKDPEANENIINFANDLAEARLLQDRMLKSGAMGVRNYQLYRSNLKSGTDQFFEIAKKYNETYERRMQRWKDNESQLMEIKVGEWTQALGGGKIYIDPNNFVVGAVTMKTVDGVDQVDGTPMPLNILSRLQEQEFDSYDLDAATTKAAKDLAIHTKADSAYSSITDIRQDTEAYAKWKESSINAILADPDNVTAILTNTQPEKGEKWDLTRDADDENPRMIYAKQGETNRFEGDFTSEKGKKQMAEARKIVDAYLEVKVDHIEKKTAKSSGGRGPSDASKKTKAADLSKLNAAMLVYTADTKAERDAALSSLNNEKYVEFRYEELGAVTINGQIFNPIKITGIPQDASKSPVHIGTIGRGMDEWLETSGATFIGVNDLNKAKTAAGYDPDEQYELGDQDWGESYYYDPTIPETEEQFAKEEAWWNEAVNSQIRNLSLSDPTSEKVFADKMSKQPLLKFFGFSVKEEVGGYNRVKLYKDGEGVIGVDGSDADGIINMSTTALSKTARNNIAEYIIRFAMEDSQAGYESWIESNPPPPED